MLLTLYSLTVLWNLGLNQDLGRMAGGSGFEITGVGNSFHRKDFPIKNKHKLQPYGMGE